MPDIESMLREAAADLPLPSDDATDRALRRVLARPEPARRPRRRAPRLTTRLLLVAAAVLALGGGIAVAFGGRIADLIRNDPGPSTINRAFERALTPVRQGGKAGEPYAGRPIRGSEHLVVERPSRWGGELRVYQARSTLGSTCYLLVRTVAIGASCELRAVATPGKPINLISATDTTSLASRTIYTEYAGRPYSARAVAVRVRFHGGGSERIALTKHWFLYEPSAAHGIYGAAAVDAIDVLDRRGATLATEPIRAHSVTSFLRPQPVLPIASTVRLLQRSTLPNGGGLVAIWSARDAKGEWCFRFLRNGRSQHSPVWDCGPQVGHYWYAPGNPKRLPLSQLPRVPIYWWTYGRGGPGFPQESWVYAAGWAAPGITRLELSFQDGTRTSVPLHGRFYLFVVPASHWRDGTRPQTLTGLDAARRRVGTVDLRPDQAGCFYPSDACSFGTG
jgi:hypothetical protein